MKPNANAKAAKANPRADSRTDSTMPRASLPQLKQSLNLAHGKDRQADDATSKKLKQNAQIYCPLAAAKIGNGSRQRELELEVELELA